MEVRKGGKGTPVCIFTFSLEQPMEGCSGVKDSLCKESKSFVWYGMVWYGTVWYGMVWYGMV